MFEKLQVPNTKIIKESKMKISSVEHTHFLPTLKPQTSEKLSKDHLNKSIDTENNRSKNFQKQFSQRSAKTMKIQQTSINKNIFNPQGRPNTLGNELKPPQNNRLLNLPQQVLRQQTPGFFIIKKSQNNTLLQKRFQNSFKITLHETEKNQQNLKQDKRSNTFNSKNFSSRSTGNLSLASLEVSQKKKRQYTRKRTLSNHRNQLPIFLRKSKHQNEISLNDFQQIKKIGQGAYGEVYMVRHRETKLLYALKILRKQNIKSSDNQQNVFREIKIHLSMNNQHIVNLFGIFNDEINIYLIVQYMMDGSLWSIWKKQRIFPQKKVSKIIQGLCKGVRYLHDNDIIHRDIKLQNIFITKGFLKLGDFGCAVRTICMRKTSLGSPNYLSPQQLGQHYYNKKIDIWSIGVVTYELLFGLSPFQDQILHFLKKNKYNPSYQLVFPAEIPTSEWAKDFLIKILQKNPNSRLDIDQVLRHPFLTKNQKGNNIHVQKQDSSKSSLKN